MIKSFSSKSAVLVILTLALVFTSYMILLSADNSGVLADKQLFTALIGLVLSLLFIYIPTKAILKSSYYFFAICILLLITAEFVGHTAMGAQRWLKIGSVAIQPSELAKIGVILALSKSFYKLNYEQIGQVRNLIIPLLIVLVPVIMILRQPNLGTSIIITLISCAIFFASGVRLWKFLVVILSAVAAMPFIWHYMHEYQKRRVMTFLNPEQDLLGYGYNIMQSKIAIGSGGLYGKGFMHGSQVQLSFLPEKHTDFICAILAEEFGFNGVISILIIYMTMIFFIYSIGLSSKNQYSRLVSVGVASFIFFHLFINIGMISGLLPVVGTPLPLLSYGRSNLITTLICSGLVINADVYRNAKV